MYDGHIAIQGLLIGSDALYAAKIRTAYHQGLAGIPFPNVFYKFSAHLKVIDGNFKEAFNAHGMQIQGQYAVHPCQFYGFRQLS